MSEDVLLVGGLDILVIERLGGLGVDPSDVKRAILETTVEVLDEASDVGQLECALNREGAVGLHLPASARGTEGSDLGVSSHDDDLLEVDETAELGELRGGIEGLELGEWEGEVGAREDLDLLMDLLGLRAASRLEVERVIHRDGATSRSGEVEVGADLGGESSEVRKLVHASVELSRCEKSASRASRARGIDLHQPRRARFERRRRREGA